MPNTYASIRGFGELGNNDYLDAFMCGLAHMVEGYIEDRLANSDSQYNTYEITPQFMREQLRAELGSAFMALGALMATETFDSNYRELANRISEIGWDDTQRQAN